MNPNILLLDIECTPMLVWSYEMYDASIVKQQRDWYITGWSVKWLGGKSTTKILPDFPAYKKDKRNDKQLMEALMPFLAEADIIIAHNGDGFDVKKINTRLIINGLEPLPVSKTIDTLKIARRNFKFSSNRLDFICQALGIGEKIHLEKDIWYDCIEKDDSKAWEKMRKYNKHDTDLLEPLYYRFLPWIKNYPQFHTKKTQCPRPGCMSLNTQSRGDADKPNYKRYRCKECTGWFQEKV